MLELRLLSNVRKEKNNLYYLHYFPSKFSNNYFRRISCGNIKCKLSVFSLVLYIVHQAVLCASSQFQVLCTGHRPSLLALERDSFTIIIPVLLPADMLMDCQEQVLTHHFSAKIFYAMSCCFLCLTPRLLQISQPYS